jgi:hypothetical protein
MIVLAPQTLKEFYEVRRTILELMDNPYMPEGKLNQTLQEKLDHMEYEIVKLVDNSFKKLCSNKNAVSYNQLAAMSEIELSELITVCWREAQYYGRFTKDNVRYIQVGVENFKYNEQLNILEWSNAESEPDVQCDDHDTKIHHLGDSKYQYSIYKIN